VWNGQDGFIGIREKFGNRYLFTELHWDAHSVHGTVTNAVDTGIDIPCEIGDERELFKFLDGLKENK